MRNVSRHWFGGQVTISALFDERDLPHVAYGARRSCGADIVVSTPNRCVVKVEASAKKGLNAINGFNVTLRDGGWRGRWLDQSVIPRSHG